MGRICHISSISALENQGHPAYCASKAAINAYKVRWKIPLER